MDKRSQKKALESGTGQFSSKRRVDASPARNTHPQDAPRWAYKADAIVTTEGHDEESQGSEEPHAEESAGTSQAAQLSQHCTPSGAGACTDSRCRIFGQLNLSRCVIFKAGSYLLLG